MYAHTHCTLRSLVINNNARARHHDAPRTPPDELVVRDRVCNNRRRRVSLFSVPYIVIKLISTRRRPENDGRPEERERDEMV